MNHGWEKKKFGECCEIVRGGSPRPIQSYLTESVNGLNWIKIGDVAPGSKYITTTKEKIKPEGLSKTRQVFKGDFILSNSMSFGRPYILKIDGCIHDGWLAIKNVNKYFNPDYLFYYLSSPITYSEFERLVKGGVVSNLNSDIVRGLVVSIPPIEVQNQIVSELDKLNELIEIKLKQLKDLDSLAQSLFYETFGDPIENPKGWEIAKLGKINEISSAKRVLVQDIVDSGVPFIRGTELAILSKQNTFDPSIFTMFMTPSHYEKVKAITGVPKLNDLLIPSINADGYVWEVNTPDPIYFKDGRVLWVHVNHEIYSSKWLKFALSKVIIEKYANLSRGAVFAELTLVFLRNLDMMVPPLPLQTEFAAKIESIEQQKSRIESTIADLQTLLESRMDYWFND
ncbi:MAG: restriction endonuclease subunit S [Muribaculaceae bacterium]|nr:restriction endonuclease subunit S [Muribaculaceae bacterium]